MLTNADVQTDDKEVNPFRESLNINNTNKTHNIMIKGKDTHIPYNLPVYICAEKGQGKTTLLRSIIEKTHKYKIFDNIIFVYSESSIDEDIPNYCVKIGTNESVDFLTQFFEIKSIYNSYYKFFKNFKLTDNTTRKQFMDAIDNNIITYNSDVINRDLPLNDIIDKVIDTGEHIIKTFSKPFKIGNIDIERIAPNQQDAIIIDDIAIMSKYLFNSIKNSDLYRYFTLTRHMKTFILLAGQQIDQLPKSLRREIMCYIVGRNTSLELLKGILTKDAIKNIVMTQSKLQQYEFVCYNKEYNTVNII